MPRTRAVSVLNCALWTPLPGLLPAKLAAIGPRTYTDVQWNVTTYGSYCNGDRTAPSPRHPAFRFGVSCGSPPIVSRKSSLSESQDPGRLAAPRGSAFFGDHHIGCGRRQA